MVSVEAEVCIDEFDDTVVLEAAIQAVLNHKQRCAVAQAHYPNHVAVQNLVERLAAVVGITELAPASTAASITSIEALRAHCGRQEPARDSDKVAVPFATGPGGP